MTGTAVKRQPERVPDRDERLIKRCLKGDQEAWSALIDRYKNLIFSIPMKLGMHQEANDIFQAVCLSLLAELPNLRKHRALPKWLMQTCYHECLRSQRLAGRRVELDPAKSEAQRDYDPLPEEMLVQLEKEQMLRDVISELPERCGQMVQMLFFETPPRPYDEIARALGLATGSIGFIRGRCLSRLRQQLEKRGFR